MRSSLKYALNKLGKIDKAVEIGQRVGKNAEVMMKETDIKQLYLVDPYLPYQDDTRIKNKLVTGEYQGFYKKGMLHRLCHFGDRISILNTTSQKASTLFDDKTFDYVYVDGDHHYEQVLNDIKSWYPKLKEDGVMGGHDFRNEFPGVLQAAVDFATLHNLKVVYNGDSDWWLKKKNLRVVSFYCPSPYKPYKKMALALEKSVKENGYNFSLYPATKEDTGSCKWYGKLYIKNAGRPMFIKRVLDDFKDDLVWMDLDCIMKDKLGDDILVDCDLAVTMRDIKDRNSQFMEKFKFINSGVMFFKNNDESRRFTDLWNNNIGEHDCDQDGLNNLLLKHSKLEQFGEIVDVDGIKVKILPARIYNFFYFPENPNGAKVLHYKGFTFRKEKVYEHSTAS